jgi:antitoxin component of RelBE/YafQ-DinJ toxin-antitoxin module
MKATLEYDLNDNVEQMAHLRAIKSLDMACVLFEITHNMKKECERMVENKDMSVYDAIDLVFNKIHETLEENNVKIDELIK